MVLPDTSCSGRRTSRAISRLVDAGPQFPVFDDSRAAPSDFDPIRALSLAATMRLSAAFGGVTCNATAATSGLVPPDLFDQVLGVGIGRIGAEKAGSRRP